MVQVRHKLTNPPKNKEDSRRLAIMKSLRHKLLEEVEMAKIDFEIRKQIGSKLPMVHKGISSIRNRAINEGIE